MLKTKNFQFPKPEPEDFYDIAIFNQVMDTLDEKLQNIVNELQTAQNHVGNKKNPHGVTKSQVGLTNVENKSSATIRSEIDTENIENALGYTPVKPEAIKNIGKIETLSGTYKKAYYYEELIDFETDGITGWTKTLSISASGAVCVAFSKNNTNEMFWAHVAQETLNTSKIKVTSVSGKHYVSAGIVFLIFTN